MQEQEIKYQELEYLRNELNQRMNFAGEHAHKILGHVMLMWGGTLAFFSTREDFVRNEFLLFITATIFFISVVVLYLFSRMDFDCAKGNSVIVAYITAFYEERPSDKIGKKRFWELALFEIAKKKKNESGGKPCKEWDTDITGEHLWLSIIAVVVIIAIFIRICFLSGLFEGDYICLGKINYFVVGCFLYIVASPYFFVKIYKNTSLNPKVLHDLRKDHLRSFLEYAIETGHYTVKSIIDRFGEEFYNDIMGD